VNEAKRVWGKGLDNLQPTGEPDWENAEFKEADGYTWDPEELGLAAG
jgi:anthranilate phosphoribosyltransferase